MSLLDHAPTFSAQDAIRLAWDLYGIRGAATPLPSERDQNFLLETESGEHYVLKIANAQIRKLQSVVDGIAVANGTTRCGEFLKIKQRRKQYSIMNMISGLIAPTYDVEPAIACHSYAVPL